MKGGRVAVIARMRAVVLDCPDPRTLADFYRALVTRSFSAGTDGARCG